MRNLTRRSLIQRWAVSSFGLLLAGCIVIPSPTAALAPANTAIPASTPTPTSSQPITLRQLADERQVEIGTESTGWLFNDPRWRDIVSREFNLAVIDWGLYWGEIEKTKGHFDFRIADSQVDFAESSRMKVRAAALLFPSTLPDWLRKGDFSKDELEGILRDHIVQIMTHYKGRVSQWVVVNEPYIYPYRRNDVFYQAFGYDYIDIAFQIARETDPSALLIYNDGSNDTSTGIMTQLTYQIVQRLKPKGLIDGVGLQMHLDGANPPGKQDVITTMKSYGIPVYITELDVNLRNVHGTQEERFARQAEIYREMVDACLESGVCNSITVWGIGDKYSYLEYPAKRV